MCTSFKLVTLGFIVRKEKYNMFVRTVVVYSDHAYYE